MVTLTREQLEERLVALHRASLQLVSDLSRNNVLERIVSMAREQANARYAAIGIVDENGKIEKRYFTKSTLASTKKVNFHVP